MNWFKWSLKTKFVSILLLTIFIPFFAVSILKEVEKTLVDNLKDRLQLTSALMSQQFAINHHWFTESLLPINSQTLAPELRVFPISELVLMDGFFDEWVDLEKYRQTFRAKSNHQLKGQNDDTMSLLLGESNNALYLSLLIKDNEVRYLTKVNANRSQQANSDMVIINYQDELGRYHQIKVVPRAPGKIPIIDQGNQNKIDWRFNAVWSEVNNGVNLELKFPNSVKPKQLNVIYFDIDKKQTRQISDIITTNQFELSAVVWPSSELSLFVKNLNLRAGQRVWLLDGSGRALAKKDQLKTLPASAQSHWFLHWLLGIKSAQITDTRENQLRLDSPVIFDALKGKSSTLLEQGSQQNYSIVTAASPIQVNDKVIGVVFIEENVASVQLLQQQKLAKIVVISGGILLVILMVLVWYISKLTARISRLKSTINQVVDEQGRMQKSQALVYEKGDELDELNNAFLTMSNRLYEYNDYLEKLASRLSHELRTPIAVVRSSLDNLKLDNYSEQQEVLNRATAGVERLGEILTRMRRASGIKQAMQTAELEMIDFCQFLTALVAGYQSSFPDYVFKFESNITHYQHNVSTDLMTELMDKLISNAMDFSLPKTLIIVRLGWQQQKLVLSVENKGAVIDKKNLKKIFRSLVSVRNKTHQNELTDNPQSTHLGLGLYVAKLVADFHGAKISAKNLNDGSGVIIEVAWSIKRQLN